MEVAKHFTAKPTAAEVDDVNIDLYTDEIHGGSAHGPERADVHVSGKKDHERRSQQRMWQRHEGW